MVRAVVVGGIVVGLMVGSVTGPATAAGEDAVPAVTSAAKGKKSVFSGSPPRWVQAPYLKKRGKRLVVSGSVLLDPVVPRVHKGNRDKLTAELFIGRPGVSTPRKPRALAVLPAKDLLVARTDTMRISRRGVQTVSFRLSRQTSRVLAQRSHRQQVASVGMSVTHWKDTFAAPRPRYGIGQWNGTSLVRRALTRAQTRDRVQQLRRQWRIDRGHVRRPDVDVKAQWNGQSPMYNTLYMTNSTPFFQQIQINPNIQCMWTGADTSANLAASVSDVAPGATVSATYEFNGGQPDTTGSTSTDSQWAGLQGATKGMNAPGTQGGLTQDLVSSATAAGQSLLISAASAGTYSEAGAVASAEQAAATFLIDFFEGLGDTSTCNEVATYPETFAVTSTVTGFGTNNSPTVGNASWTDPAGWNVTPPPNVTGSGAWGGESLQVGTQTYSYPQPPTCSSPTPAGATPQETQWCGFVYGSMQPMLGAQTSATYYWNGGQPAYMVSNNAASDTNTGGAATFQGGLFQNIGPNPGTPGDAWCQYDTGVWSNCSYGINNDAANFENYNPPGTLFGQLTYLSSPAFTVGLAIDNAPVATATQVQQGGDTKTQLTCDLSGLDTQLNLPFGPGTSTYSTQLATAVSKQSDATGQWQVNYYAVDKKNRFVYDSESFDAQDLKGANPEPQDPDLGPGSNTQIAQLTQDTVSATIDTTGVSYVTLKGKASSPTQWGCSATPIASFPGLPITQPAGTGTSGIFGTTTDGQGNIVNTGWPMPGNHTGWPTSLFTPYDNATNYSWQWPVEEINIAFGGVTQASPLVAVPVS